MRYFRIKVKSFLSIILISCWMQATAQLYTTKTEDLQLIYYSKNHEYIVPHLRRCFTNSFGFHRTLFDYHPTEDVTILLQDFGDYGHGGADALPNNNVNVGIGPFGYIYETMPATERMNWLMHHELTHIVTTDMASKTDHLFRRIFRGKVTPTIDNPISIFYSYLTNPRRYSPRWYHEGFAVFMETWMSGGRGRVLGGYDEMVFRTKVRDNSHIYDMVGLESEGKTSDFMVGVNSYLYGTRFISYLAYTHGIDKLLQWISRTDDSKGYFVAQFKKVYGTDIDEEWSRWIEWERSWQQANLDSINQYPVTPYRPVSNRALGSVSRCFLDRSRGKLYAGVRYPGQVAHIAAIDLSTGRIEKIHDIEEGAALFSVFHSAFNRSSQTLFYTTDNHHLRDLRSIDLNTGNSRLLIRDLRAGDLAFNPVDKSLWGVRHADGLSTVIRIAPPYDDWHSSYTLDYGNDIYDLDISPDGRYLIAALVDLGGFQKLVRFNLEDLSGGLFEPEVIFDFDVSSPANFVYSPDGLYIYGSSYYTGVSNIFRYDVALDSMEVISNCETGFFRPVPFSADSVIVMNYTGAGFLPVMIPNQTLEDVSATNYLGMAIVDRHPVVLDWFTKAPRLDVLATTIYSGAYVPLKNMRLSSVYPVVQGYKASPSYGAHLDFQSKLGLSRLDLTATVSPDPGLAKDERLHFQFNFQTIQFGGPLSGSWKLGGGYHAADFFDLFGPTKRSRKGYFLKLGYNRRLTQEWPVDLALSLAGYGNLEILPEFQNVPTSFDRFLSSSAGLSFSEVRKSLGAVDDEKGFQWDLLGTANYVNQKLYPRIQANLNYGLLPLLDHAPLWIRTSAGYSFADRDDPQADFANFYFGGFGNNWLDYLGVKRYREHYSFPGLDLNHTETEFRDHPLGGTNFTKLLGEWILPPLRYRRVGGPMLFLNWSRLSLFTSTIVTNLDDRDSRMQFYNYGLQIDTRLVLFSHLTATFSLGYAYAFEKDPHGSEWVRHQPGTMVSLQILK